MGNWSIIRINQLCELVLSGLGRISLELVILAAVIFGLLWLIRVKSPTIRYWFYCLVMIKPLAAILIASPVSLYWFLAPQTEIAPELSSFVEQRIAAESVPVVNHPRHAYFQRTEIRQELPPAATPWWKELNSASYIVFVWLVIMIILSIRLLAGSIYVYLLCVRAKELPPGPETEPLDRARNLMNISGKVRVAVTAQVSIPILAGIFRPLILIPEGFRTNLSSRQVEMIFAHELGHIKRRDNLLLLLQRLIEMFWFFHPVVWFCGREMRIEAEKACDDLVVACYGDGAEYAASLASAAEMRDRFTRRLLINTFAASESGLSMRVKRILNGPRGKTVLWITVLTVTVLLAVAVCGLPSASKRENKTEIEIKKGESRMEKKSVQTAGDKSNMTVEDKQPDAKMLKDVPAGKSGSNGFGRGLAILCTNAGIPADYDMIMGELGLAFIMQASDAVPKIDGALDVGWWPLAWDCLPRLLETYRKISGVKINWVGISYDEYKGNPEKYYHNYLQAEIEKSIGKGKPVLGNFGDWLVIAGYDNKARPPLFVFCPGGDEIKVEASSSYPIFAVTVGEKVSPLEIKEAGIELLKQAVALGRDQIAMQCRYFTGQKAFELWIKTLRDFDNRGQARHHANVVYNLKINRRSAIKCIRTIAARFPEKTAAHLNNAAGIYEEILRKLDTADTSQKALIESSEGREKLAVLAGQIAVLEESAVNEIEKALEAEGVKIEKTENSSANTAGVKKIIAGVPPISWQTGDCSFAGALSAALAATEHPYSYTDIMGYSALAFRVRWRGEKNRRNEPWWCGSIPVGEFQEEVERTSAMTGWQFGSTGMLDSAPEKIKQYIPDVIKSIDKGMPVIGYPTVKNLNCGVIYGCGIKDARPVFYWRELSCANQTDTTLIPADESGPWFLFLKSWKQPADAKERFIESLKQCVVNWHRGPSGNEKYYTYSYGADALKLWIKDLQDADSFTEKQRNELFFVNAWNYNTLKDARAHAVRYLEANSILVPDKAREHLIKAVKLYQRELEMLRSTPDAFRGPSGGRKIEDWTSQIRKCEAEIIAQALECEKQAVTEIEQVLTTENIKVN